MNLKSKHRTPQLEVSDRLYFRNLPPECVVELVRVNTHPNPAYLAATKYSHWNNCDLPQFLEYFWHEPSSQEFAMQRGGFLEALPQDMRNYLLSLPRTDSRLRSRLPANWLPAPLLTPTPEQQALLDQFEDTRVNGLRPFGNYLLLASTAVGKTVLGLLLAQRLRRKTLVLCPTDLILRGWFADAEKCFGVKRNQLGLVKRDKFQLRDLTFASPQTLHRRREHWPKLNEEFGTIIVDEAHMLTAPTMYEFVEQCRAEYLIGLTATESVDNGRLNVPLRALLGPACAELHSSGVGSNSMQVTSCNIVRTAFEYEGVADSIDWHELMNQYVTDEARNELIVDSIRADWLNGRCVLVTTRSLEHVNLLCDMLEEAGVANVNRLTGDTNGDRFYTEQLLKQVAAGKITCVVATISAIKVGANVPRLDSLHMATPMAKQHNIEQLIGRIRRVAAGKDRADVTYYLDKGGYFAHLLSTKLLPVCVKLGISANI